MSKRRRNRPSPVGQQVATPVETAQPKVEPIWSRCWILIVVLAALLVRIIYFIQFSRMPFAHTLFLDAREYDDWANVIRKGGDISPGKPYFVEPGYAYVLTAVKAVGGGIDAVRILQASIGIGSAVLTGLLARRIGGNIAALIAGTIAALYLPLIYFEGLLLKTTLEIFLFLLVLNLASPLVEKPRSAAALGLGLLIGLGTLLRSNLLMLAPLIVVWSYFVLKSQGATRPWVLGLVLLIGTVPPLVGVGLRNHAASGEWAVLPYNSGINFYIGNASTSDGFIPQFSFLRYDPKYEELDSVAEASRRAGHPVTATESSRFWWTETGREIVHDPGHWFWVMGNKFMLWANWYELTDNESIYFVRKYTPLLNWPLPGYVVALPLGLAGLAWAIRRRNSTVALCAAFILIQVTSVLIFHVADRYRLPAVPIMIVLGACAVVDVARRRAPVIPVASGAFIGLVLVLLPTPGMPNGQDLSNHEAMLGVAAANSGNMSEAIASFKQGVAENSSSATGYFNLAAALKNSGDYAGAEPDVRKAITLDPGNGDAHQLLGDILMHDQRPLEAAPEYVAAATADPSKASLWASAASAYGAAGQMDNAALYADRAVKADPSYEPGWFLKGNAAFARHDVGGAKAAWTKALELQPNDVTVKKYLSILGRNPSN